VNTQYTIYSFSFQKGGCHGLLPYFIVFVDQNNSNILLKTVDVKPK